VAVAAQDAVSGVGAKGRQPGFGISPTASAETVCCLPWSVCCAKPMGNFHFGKWQGSLAACCAVGLVAGLAKASEDDFLHPQPRHLRHWPTLDFDSQPGLTSLPKGTIWFKSCSWFLSHCWPSSSSKLAVQSSILIGHRVPQVGLMDASEVLDPQVSPWACFFNNPHASPILPNKYKLRS